MNQIADALPPLSHSATSGVAVSDCRHHSDSDVLAEIFGRHREMVYRVCLRWLGHHHDAEDVTQETFRRAAIAIHTWDNRRPIEPWLVTIAGNRCRSFLSCRRREKLTESIDHFRDEYSAMALEDRSVNEQQTIAEDCLLHAMEGLPRNHRRAFELVHREELSYPQAAQQMGRSVGTIKTWVHRARTAMRKTLQRDSLRRTVAASVASLLLICGWFVSRPIESRFSGENLRSSGENATAIVSPRHAQEIMGNLRLGAGVPHANLSSIDWQLASLQAFTQTNLQFDQIETMPHGTIPFDRWIQQSAPVIEQLQQGVAPVGRTLRNVMMLFSFQYDTVGVTSEAGTSDVSASSLASLEIS